MTTITADQLKPCQYCGEEVKSEAVKCKHCNEYIGEKTSKVSRTVYVLLGLFLGSLGIHNFYAGRTKYALIQLFITLFLCWTIIGPVIVGFWALIELFVVSKDGKGLAMI